MSLLEIVKKYIEDRHNEKTIELSLRKRELDLKQSQLEHDKNQLDFQIRCYNLQTNGNAKSKINGNSVGNLIALLSLALASYTLFREIRKDGRKDPDQTVIAKNAREERDIRHLNHQLDTGEISYKEYLVFKAQVLGRPAPSLSIPKTSGTKLSSIALARGPSLFTPPNLHPAVIKRFQARQKQNQGLTTSLDALAELHRLRSKTSSTSETNNTNNTNSTTESRNGIKR